MRPKFELLAGESLFRAIYRIQLYLKQYNLESEWLEFNEIKLLINVNSIVNDIEVIYNLKCELRRLTKS